MIHPPMLQNITMLYYAVILTLSIDIVKNTHAILLDFFSQVGRGNGSFIVHDGSVTIHGRTLSDAPCITIFIQLEGSNLFLSQGTRSQFPAYCLFSGIYKSLIYTILRHKLFMCSFLYNSSFINNYYLICMTNSL